MIVTCSCCRLLELSGKGSPGIPILSTGNISSRFLSLALEQIELTWVQNGPVRFGWGKHAKNNTLAA